MGQQQANAHLVFEITDVFAYAVLCECVCVYVYAPEAISTTHMK